MQDWFGSSEGSIKSATHPVEGFLAGLSDPRCHKGREGLRSGSGGRSLNHHVNAGGDGGAIDEQLPGGPGQKTLLFLGGK